MKVLLLHPEDSLPAANLIGWDLIVDLGQAPHSIYDAWSRQAGCRVESIFSYARGFEDLYALRRVFQDAKGKVVDQSGIDWWEILLPMLLPEIEQSFLLVRLTEKLEQTKTLYCTRHDARVSALEQFLGVEIQSFGKEPAHFAQVVRRYRKILSHLDFDQLTQIAQDKFDSQHKIRRRLASGKYSSNDPVFLLPSAYINTSRTAISYAAMLPDKRFLLAVARPGGKLRELPANVQMISLDAYFDQTDDAELASLLAEWRKLQRNLVNDHAEFRLAEALGMFQRIPQLMRWTIAARDAWVGLFNSTNIAGCLSADDANPYSSLPVAIANQRDIPTLAVHHGALDHRMSVRDSFANSYLAKGELERDFLLHACRVDPARIALGAPEQALPKAVKSTDRPWLVFFSEPYGNYGWRMESVYQSLLPELCAIAAQCNLKLVFKLHPFESIKGHRHLLRKLLPADVLEQIHWIAGPPTEELWMKTRFAMTVESTVALECTTRDIPVFLCAWLQNACGGYLQQYAKFRIGHILNAPAEMKNIPRLLEGGKSFDTPAKGIWQTIEPEVLRGLLTGIYPLRTANAS